MSGVGGVSFTCIGCSHSNQRELSDLDHVHIQSQPIFIKNSHTQNTRNLCGHAVGFLRLFCGRRLFSFTCYRASRIINIQEVC